MLAEFTQKTRFLSQMRAYGIRNVLISADFLVAVAILIALWTDAFFDLSIFRAQDSTFLVAIFAAASTLFAITLATLAIVLSFAGSDFVRFLRQHEALDSILFIFWLGNASYLVVVALSLVYLLIDFTGLEAYAKYFACVIAAVFVYAVIGTFYLLGSVVRFAHFLNLFETSRE